MNFFSSLIDQLPLSVQNFFNVELLGNSIESYFFAILLFALFLGGLKLFLNVVLARLARLTSRTATTLDDNIIGILQRISSFFFYFLAFYFTIKTLNVDGRFQQFLDGVFILLVIIEVIKVALNILELTFNHIPSIQHNQTALNGVKLIMRMTLWSIGILLVLSNLGFDISTLAASMGIGGIAIALAAQNILSDLFASFTIYFDQPFQIGDFIVIGTDKGTVKRIGLKTTRLQTLQGEELVISNRELTEARVQNFKKMQRRRIIFALGVEYGTDAKKLKKIPEIVNQIIEKQDGAEPSRAHFKDFGDFSLNYEVVYFVNSREYGEFMDTQQGINLSIVEAFEKEGISMAFPTQTIHVVKS